MKLLSAEVSGSTPEGNEHYAQAHLLFGFLGNPSASGWLLGGFLGPISRIPFRFPWGGPGGFFVAAPSPGQAPRAGNEKHTQNSPKPPAKEEYPKKIPANAASSAGNPC